MVGVSNIGFYAEPANPRRMNGLRAESGVAATPVTALGEDAAEVGETARMLAKANEQEEKLQAERLEQIRQSLEQGTYRVQEVLLQVAARIAKVVQ